MLEDAAQGLDGIYKVRETSGGLGHAGTIMILLMR